jgi:hypothetical protein
MTKVPSKIRYFAWRLALQLIPTGDVLYHRNMENTSMCAICQGSEDSWKHSLLDCLMARSVWALFDEELAEHLTAHNTSDAKQWIFHLIETLKHEEFVKVLVVLWVIWTARRKAKYMKGFFTAHYLSSVLS